MKSVLEWYEDDSPSSQETSIGQIVTSTPEKENHEVPSQEEDHVLANEYENCLKAVGITEFLKGKLANYLAMTQDQDLEGFKKDEMKNGLKEVVNELSNTIAEL